MKWKGTWSTFSWQLTGSIPSPDEAICHHYICSNKISVSGSIQMSKWPLRFQFEYRDQMEKHSWWHSCGRKAVWAKSFSFIKHKLCFKISHKLLGLKVIPWDFNLFIKASGRDLLKQNFFVTVDPMDGRSTWDTKSVHFLNIRVMPGLSKLGCNGLILAIEG